MKIDQALNLIREYLNDVSLFMKYFKQKYYREDVLRAWHDKTISQNGNVSDTIEYELHGVGCCIFFPNREVDFDFGPGSRSDGFDLWRLKKYLKQRPDISKTLSIEELETSFNALIDSGRIAQNFQGCHLYFFQN